MPDIGYRMLRAVVGFGSGGKEGDLVVILPARPVSAKSVDLGRQTADAMRSWQSRMTAEVNATEVQLTAVLYRGQMSLSALRALEPGSEIPLPQKAENRIRLEGIDGAPVATGKIGMLGRMKALQILAIGDVAPTAATDVDKDVPIDVADIYLRELGIITQPTEDQAADGGDTPTGYGLADWDVDLSAGTTENDAFDDLPELNIAG